MNEVKYVRQEDACGCVIACLAMVTGETYQAVANEFTPNEAKAYGVTREREIEYLVRNGFSVTLPAFPMICMGNVYIATVPSLNKKGGTHAIVVDCTDYQTGCRVLDPQRGNAYKRKRYYTNKNLRSYPALTLIDKLAREDAGKHDDNHCVKFAIQQETLKDE